MTVNDLINALKRCNRNAEVKVSFVDNLCIRDDKVLASYETNKVYIVKNKKMGKVVILGEAK